MPAALFVTTVASTLQAFLTPFADHFRAEGWRIDALSNGAVGCDAIAPHFDARYDASWSRNPLDVRNLFGTVGEVRHLIAENRYDLVHVHTPVAAFVTRRAVRTLPPANRPVVVYTAHGFHFYRGQPPRPHAVFRALERIAAPWTDWLVVINAEDLDAARALGGIPSERIRLIPGIGVDTEAFAPGAVSAEEAARVRKQLGGTDRFLIAMVAELAPLKRHAFALRALAHSHEPHLRLALVGTGPLARELHDEVRALGLEQRVTFAGYRTDMPSVFAAADALLLCSEREGLNRSALEAMASGKPVIGTDTRGIADAVGPDAGWIVPRHDGTALAAAMDAAAADPAEAARRGALGRQRAIEEFALPKIVAAYDALYKEALETRRANREGSA
jgi:glycosyltransferase involved in cell wall biosynthesis